MNIQTRQKARAANKQRRMLAKQSKQQVRWARNAHHQLWRLNKLKQNDYGIYDSAYEDWRSTTSEFWDSEWVIDDFMDRMRSVGVHVCSNQTPGTPDVYFTGFWSQGDGASFRATVEPNVAFFQDNPELYDDWAVIADLAPDLDSIGITHNTGFYSHSHGMSVDSSEFVCSTDPEEWCLSVSEIQSGIFEGMRVHDAVSLYTEEQMEEFCEIVLGICRGYADELYKDLESDYDWNTSTERFDEYLATNGWEYDEDGAIYVT